MVIVDGSSPTSLDSGSQEGVSSHRGSAGVAGDGLVDHDEGAPTG